MLNMHSSYDLVSYPGSAYKDTHPDHLAGMATLFGMVPPNVQSCRVLEIGCGDGSNLIPMAVGLPESKFVGVELAVQPVEKATKTIELTGLENVEIRQMNLLDIGADFGEFDYIIAHGVYSWTAQPVREHLLTVCGRNLAEKGVAFVSYNTYPAGHIRQASRELMLFHLRSSENTVVDPVKEGKQFLNLILRSIDGHDVWKSVLESESMRLNKREDDRVTYHDEFSPNYGPVYFSDFAEEARRCGLQFLTEARIRDAVQPPVSPGILQMLSGLAENDVVRFQQYLDFVCFVGFRGTLLCHQEIPLQRTNFSGRLNRLHLASPLIKLQTDKNGSTTFRNSRGPGTIQTNDLNIVAALQCLERRWPQSEKFENLARKTLNRLQARASDEALTGFAEALLQLAVNSLVDIRSHKFHLADVTGKRPIASPLARLQAREQNLLTTLLHNQIDVSDQGVLRVIQLLDGTRDLTTVAHTLSDENPSLPRIAIDRLVKEAVESCRRLGLLLA